MQRVVHCSSSYLRFGAAEHLTIFCQGGKPNPVHRNQYGINIKTRNNNELCLFSLHVESGTFISKEINKWHNDATMPHPVRRRSFVTGASDLFFPPWMGHS